MKFVHILTITPKIWSYTNLLTKPFVLKKAPLNSKVLIDNSIVIYAGKKIKSIVPATLFTENKTNFN